METDQQTLEVMSTRIHADVRPHEGGYEWAVKEYSYGARRWVVIDSGDSAHWAVALADLAMAISILAEGQF